MCRGCHLPHHYQRHLTCRRQGCRWHLCFRRHCHCRRCHRRHCRHLRLKRRIQRGLRPSLPCSVLLPCSCSRPRSPRLLPGCVIVARINMRGRSQVEPPRPMLMHAGSTPTCHRARCRGRPKTMRMSRAPSRRHSRQRRRSSCRRHSHHHRWQDGHALHHTRRLLWRHRRGFQLYRSSRHRFLQCHHIQGHM